MTHVFTYGSLMFPEVWTLVVAGRYRSLGARLVGHERFAVRGQDYPGVVARPGGAVDGLLYLDVDADDVARLDHFEGDEYRREVVTLDCADGVERRGETYVFLPAERLLDAAWDPNAFAMERFLATYCRDRLGQVGIVNR